MDGDSLNILIGVIKSKQNNETWKLFRLLLANSTNKFINSTDIKVEKCRCVLCKQCACVFVCHTSIHCCFQFLLSVLLTRFSRSEDDVILINTLPCQSTWPNAQNCVEIDFSIQLNPKSTMKTATNETQVEDTTYAMKHDDLVSMWTEIGRKDFADNGYQVCVIQVKLYFYCN